MLGSGQGICHAVTIFLPTVAVQEPAVQWRSDLLIRWPMDTDKSGGGASPSLMKVLGSVLASMFGVQSNRRREEDFTHGKPSQYVVIGLLVTLVFILTVWGVVSLVMRLAGI